MNTKTSLRFHRASRPFVLAVTLLTLALPLTSRAQGNSNNTPAVDHRQNLDNGNNGNGNNGVAPVPEPATWAAMASLVALGALFARRHFKQSDGSVA
jgi:hypothetical protein